MKKILFHSLTIPPDKVSTGMLVAEIASGFKDRGVDVEILASTPQYNFDSNVDSNAVNGDGDAMIAYCFAEKEGYSKFGRYEGNGNSDGIFIYTGFRPAWLMIKNIDTDGEDWHMFDNKRAPTNVVKARLVANENYAENTNDSILDFTSNGFKLRDTNAGYNSAVTFVYFAFAEAPFKYANAR